MIQNILDPNTFLSTPSARRATPSRPARRTRTTISIHALREEGDPNDACAGFPDIISIHALREEGDFSHLLRRAVLDLISIHALREEGDRRF